MSQPPDRRPDWPADDPEPDPDSPTPPHGMRPIPRDRPGRSDRPDPLGRPHRSDRPGQDDRPDRPDRGDRLDRLGRDGRPGRSDRDDQLGYDDDHDDGDDTDDGGPADGVAVVERDRIWVHLVWEAVLLVGIVAIVLALAALDDNIVSSTRGLEFLLIQIAGTGLIATGLACSLRAAVPNLAVGAVGVTAAVLLARIQGEDVGFFPAALLVLVAAVAVGVALAVVVIGLHVPAWAASLGVSLLVVGLATVVNGRTGTGFRPEEAVTDVPWLWFALFVMISVGGGLACAAPAVRQWLGGTRGDRDPADRPGAAPATGAALALVASTVLAAFGGIVLSSGLGFAEPATPTGSVFVALAAVLVGGVSAFGRRGGVFGTLLGVVLVILTMRLALRTGTDLYNVVLGAAIVGGLAVTRLLEAVGRRTVPVRPEPSRQW